MTLVDPRRLEELEVIIDKGRKSFVEVGNALAEIRDTGLYRVKNDTFEDYCKERWGFTKPYAYRLMKGAEIVGEMVPHGTTALPNNEHQTRQLARLEDPEVRQEVWDRVLETDGENASASVVKQIVDSVKAAMPVVTSMPAFRKSSEAQKSRAILDSLPKTSQQEMLDTRAWLMGLVVRAREITNAKPEVVAPMLDERTSEALDRFMVSMNAWIERMRNEMKPHLRVVGGSDHD